MLGRLRVRPEHPGDDVIDDDLILVWDNTKRVITGGDLLGRLLRGIATSRSRRALDDARRTNLVRCTPAVQPALSWSARGSAWCANR